MAQLYFYYSAMNAGKSTSLLQSAYNYQERGMTVAIYTAALDNRYGLGKVSSRIGLAMDAHIFNGSFNFVSHVKHILILCNNIPLNISVFLHSKTLHLR